jgi:hypothetical protein
MKLVSRGFALAVVTTVVVGCAAGRADPPGPGSAGQGAGTAGSSGTGGATAGTGASGSTGTAGTACVTPPVVKTAWSIGRDATSPEISCATAGAATVQLFMNTTRTEFSCDSKMGTSMGLDPGSYVPRVLLAGAQGTVLSQGNLNAVTIPSCGVTDLGRLRFVVAPTGAAGAGGSGGGAGGTGGAGGSGGGAGGSGGGAGGTGGGTGPCNALPIFAVHSCAAVMACHDANGSAAGFNMASSGWEKNLVGGKPKVGGAPGLGSVCVNSGKQYLIPGSVPAQGLFLDKLMSAKPACGAQMPLIPPNLTAQELDCVQRWANGLTKP